ncbi:MAG: hypothetical protein QXF41_00355 [Candidatus Micrarchaeaceae archaeon]
MREKPLVEEEKARSKMKLYISLVIIAILIALLSFLAVPRGTPLQRCLGIISLQNRYSCIMALSLSSGNASLCTYLPRSYEAECYYGLAINSSSSLLCYKAYNISSTLGSSCFEKVANSTGDYAICGALTGAERDSCISNVAIKNGNATLCSMLYNSTNGEICESAIYLGRAQETLNASFCTNVANTTDPSVIDSIFLKDKYASSFVSNASLAALKNYASISTFGISARDMCVTYVAVMLKNTSVCNTISPDEARQLCNSLVTIPKPSNVSLSNAFNSTICTKLGLNSEQCNLLSGLISAVASKNVTACGNLPPVTSYECYTAFAVQYKNTSYCGFIKNATANSACIEKVSLNVTG